jgi:hypothetical protein
MNDRIAHGSMSSINVYGIMPNGGKGGTGQILLGKRKLQLQGTEQYSFEIRAGSAGKGSRYPPYPFVAFH